MFEQVEINSERWFDLTPLKNEEFRDIKGYEGLYQISNYGRVKSLQRKVNSGIKNSGYATIKEKIIKFGIDGGNYFDAHLSKNSKTKIIKVHRLVAKAFISNPDNLPQINHKDENKHNNCVENLEWCNRQYNINYGSRNNKVSLKNSKKIVQKNINGEIIKIWNSIKEASEKLNINLSTIAKCCSNKYYSKTSHNFIWEYLEGND